MRPAFRQYYIQSAVKEVLASSIYYVSVSFTVHARKLTDARREFFLATEEQDYNLLVVTYKSRLGPLAVTRNRARRRLRWAFKEVLPTAAPGYEYAVVAKLPALVTDFKALKQEISFALKMTSLDTPESDAFMDSHNLTVPGGRHISDPAAFACALYSAAHAKQQQNEVHAQLNVLLNDILTDRDLFTLVCLPVMSTKSKMSGQQQKAFYVLLGRASLAPALKAAIKVLLRLQTTCLVETILAFNQMHQAQAIDIDFEPHGHRAGRAAPVPRGAAEEAAFQAIDHIFKNNFRQ